MGKNKKIFYYHSFENTEITEGGASRNIAFYSYFKLKNQAKYINANNKVSTLITNFILYACMDNKIIVNQALFLEHNRLVGKLVKCKMYFAVKFFLYLLTLKKNVYLEVNDLPVEQYIDLELVDVIHKPNKNLYDILYSCKKMNYIFASEEMRKYVINKYGIRSNNTFVCINGAYDYDVIDKPLFSNDKINCIYAGSLNKGRQIEELINIFKYVKTANLILCGTWGEWLSDLELPSNVKYFGSLSEEAAAKLTQSCDMGIIPYSEKREYYNLCYPTKNSFYLVNNVCILSTCLDETMSQIPNSMSYYANIEDWIELLNNLSKLDILEKKRTVDKNKYMYQWDYLIRNLELKIEKNI